MKTQTKILALTVGVMCTAAVAMLLYDHSTRTGASLLPVGGTEIMLIIYFSISVLATALVLWISLKKLADQKQVEETLLDRELLLRATLDSTADGILVVRQNGMASHWNARFREMWRIPENILEERDDEKMIRYVLSQLRDPEAFVAKVQALYNSSEESFDVLQFRDGRVFERFSCPLMIEGKNDGRVWSFRDVTERSKADETRRELQDALDRAQRMESLGILAGGVAHDLNNILGPVVGYSDMLRRQLSQDSETAAKLAKITKSAEEAAAVIQDLLALARRGKYEMHLVKINDVVTAYAESTGFEKLREIYPSTMVEVNLPSEIGFIAGSEPHLGKVILNLVTNAFEAMPSGGTLSISTEQGRLDHLFGGFQKIEAGEYVIVRIKDTGEGIPKENLPKIFEPYFSKKKNVQRGSGLGLAVVYGILKDHRGYYDVFSTVGKGTEFILYFPVSPESANAARKAACSITGRSGRVLIVEDSAEQRELCSEIISGLGYKVDTVENGHQAVEFVARQRVDIIVLDMIMEPGFDGLDAYTEILKFNPHQKVIIVSGYSATDRVQEMQRLGAGRYVKKPYRIDALAQALREELSLTNV